MRASPKTSSGLESLQVQKKPISSSSLSHSYMRSRWSASILPRVKKLRRTGMFIISWCCRPLSGSICRRPAPSSSRRLRLAWSRPMTFTSSGTLCNRCASAALTPPRFLRTGWSHGVFVRSAPSLCIRARAKTVIRHVILRPMTHCFPKLFWTMLCASTTLGHRRRHPATVSVSVVSTIHRTWLSFRSRTRPCVAIQDVFS